MLFLMNLIYPYPTATQLSTYANGSNVTVITKTYFCLQSTKRNVLKKVFNSNQQTIVK
jgi:hypothetical protein